MFSHLILAGMTLLAATSVQAHPASPLAVAVVTEQFTQAKLVPEIFPKFEPSGTLIANWSTVGVSTTGQVIPVGDTAVKPQISIKGSAEAEATVGGPFNDTSTLYTVLIVDANVPGTTNSTSLVRHYLANDLTYGPNSDHAVLLTNTTPAIQEYAGPAPPQGSGPHRYVIMAFAQPENFTAPEGLNEPGVAVGRFDPNAYIEATGLILLSASYFVVEVGTSTFSIAATSSIDSTTFAEYTPTSAGAAHGTAPPASETSAPASGAASNGLSAVAGAFALVAVAVGIF